MVSSHRSTTAIVDEMPLEEKFARNESCFYDYLYFFALLRIFKYINDKQFEYDVTLTESHGTSLRLLL